MFFADTDMANKGLDSKKNYRILSWKDKNHGARNI
jgi:hypothetical protein